MTREQEAITYFEGMKKRLEDFRKIYPSPDTVGYQATTKEIGFYDMAISALSAKADNTMEWLQHVDYRVDNSGKWRRKCSKCGHETSNFGHENFCPNCGRKAVSE